MEVVAKAEIARVDLPSVEAKSAAEGSQRETIRAKTSAAISMRLPFCDLVKSMFEKLKSGAKHAAIATASKMLIAPPSELAAFRNLEFKPKANPRLAIAIAETRIKGDENKLKLLAGDF